MPVRRAFTVEFAERLSNIGSWGEGMSVALQPDSLSPSFSGDRFSIKPVSADRGVSFGHKWWNPAFRWCSDGVNYWNNSIECRVRSPRVLFANYGTETLANDLRVDDGASTALSVATVTEDDTTPMVRFPTVTLGEGCSLSVAPTNGNVALSVENVNVSGTAAQRQTLKIGSARGGRASEEKKRGTYKFFSD